MWRVESTVFHVDLTRTAVLADSRDTGYVKTEVEQIPLPPPGHFESAGTSKQNGRAS